MVRRPHGGHAHTKWSSDELKGARGFGRPDPDAEPRTYRWHASDTEPRHVGAIQDLPQTVGGGTVHWDAKTPRFWDIDFQKRSLLGPIRARTSRTGRSPTTRSRRCTTRSRR